MSEHAKIIAVDFDGTLVENHHPDIGPPIWGVVARVRAEQEKGTKVILWTCRRGEALAAAVRVCEERMGLLPFAAVNENLPEIIEAFGGDTRKIFANEYWDDRAVRMP